MEPIEKWLCHTCGQSGMGTGRDHVCPMVTPHARDPDLRKAALDALLQWRELGVRLSAALEAALLYDERAVRAFTESGAIEKANKAMDALREALAK